jgi:hypothetical protein
MEKPTDQKKASFFLNTGMPPYIFVLFAYKNNGGLQLLTCSWPITSYEISGWTAP